MQYMRQFDYSFLKNSKVSVKILDLTVKIEGFKIKINDRKNDYSDIFIKLESVAKVQSVKGSNAIEGIVTTDKRIEEIVAGNSSPLNHDEMEIAGYCDVLNIIHNKFDVLKLQECQVCT